MYEDFYFRFPDELAGEQALVSLFATVAVPNVDRLGTIFSRSGQPVAGWHVNVRLAEGEEVPAAMAPYQIAAPLYPKRVWLSEDTEAVV